MATGEDEGAVRFALLGYLRGVGESPPTTERAVATRWGNLDSCDIEQGQLRGATGAAIR